MLGQGCLSLITHGVLPLLILPMCSGELACPFLLCSLPSLKASCHLLDTQSSQGKRLDLVLVTWGPPPPFHTWPLSGALLNPSTCCRALDTIGFLLSRNSCSPSHRPKPRRRSRSPELPQMGVGVGCWATVHWRRASDPSHLSHSMEPLRKTSSVPDKASTTQTESRRQKSPPTPSLAQEPSS